MRWTIAKEEFEARELLRSLRFDCSIVDPRILEGFQLTDSPLDWIGSKYYSLTADVVAMVKDCNREFANPLEFISVLSRMDKITGIRVCLFQVEDSKWASLVAIERMQRTISMICSGDGWCPDCQFAVKPKSAI